MADRKNAGYKSNNVQLSPQRGTFRVHGGYSPPKDGPAKPPASMMSGKPEASPAKKESGAVEQK